MSRKERKGLITSSLFYFVGNATYKEYVDILQLISTTSA